MTTFYPSQPTPSFLKKYAKNVYNRVQHDAHAHHMNGFENNDEASLHLQVRQFCATSDSKNVKMIIQSENSFGLKTHKRRRGEIEKMRVKINISRQIGFKRRVC